MITQNEQKLVDICFQLTLTIKSHSEHFANLSQEEVAEWTAKQLRECGFDTSPCGASWGLLTNTPRSTNGS